MVPIDEFDCDLTCTKEDTYWYRIKPPSCGCLWICINDIHIKSIGMDINGVNMNIIYVELIITAWIFACFKNIICKWCGHA